MSKTTANKKFIDIDNLIKSKNPRLLKIIPRFILNYIKRVVHQDETNDFIFRNKDKYDIDFANAISDEYIGVLTSCGLENIDVKGRYIIVANHPLGGIDGIGLISEVAKVRKDIKFPVNDLLTNLKNLSGIFIPVNKHGSNAQNINVLDEVFSSDNVVLYFPAGLVSRKQKGGIIKDLEWKKTFISKAKKYKRDIIPAYIEGENSKFFYNFARIRKILGIKVNIEMIYLPGEMYKQKRLNRPLNITFGRKIPYKTFNKRYSDIVWTEKVKEFVYGLKTQPFKDFKYNDFNIL